MKKKLAHKIPKFLTIGPCEPLQASSTTLKIIQDSSTALKMLYLFRST